MNIKTTKVDGVSFNAEHYADKTKEEFIAAEGHHFNGDAEKLGKAFDLMFPSKLNEGESEHSRDF